MPLTTKPNDVDIDGPVAEAYQPVTVTYVGRRVKTYRKTQYIIYCYQVYDDFWFQYKVKPFAGKHRTGDVFDGTTDENGYVDWQSLRKTGRAPDREASVWAVQEQVSLIQRKTKPKDRSDDAIRADLNRYRNLYRMASTTNAKAALLASVIQAIVGE